MLDIFGTLVTGTETGWDRNSLLLGYFWYAGDIFGALGTETVCWIFLVRWRLGQKQFVGYFWYAGDWDRNSLLGWIFLVGIGYFW